MHGGNRLQLRHRAEICTAGEKNASAGAEEEKRMKESGKQRVRASEDQQKRLERQVWRCRGE